jgi:hypothetical protein
MSCTCECFVHISVLCSNILQCYCTCYSLDKSCVLIPFYVPCLSRYPYFPIFFPPLRWAPAYNSLFQCPFSLKDHTGPVSVVIPYISVSYCSTLCPVPYLRDLSLSFCPVPIRLSWSCPWALFLSHCAVPIPSPCPYSRALSLSQFSVPILEPFTLPVPFLFPVPYPYPNALS